jgi:uncharacterized cupin superfamily protein
MEPFMVEIEPAEPSNYMLSSHEGEEFIYVMEGRIEVNYGRIFSAGCRRQYLHRFGGGA